MPALTLHIPTLVVATVIVAMLLGALLFVTWLQDRSHRALLWWAPAYFLVAGGTTLLALRGLVPDFLTYEMANAALLLAAGFTFAGARVFERRPVALWWLAVAPATWIVACQLPLFANSLRLRIIIASLMLAGLLLLAAREFWRGRDERLISRWSAMIVVTVYAAGMLVRLPVVLLVDLPPAQEVFRTQWFALMSLGTLLYTTTLAFTLLAMTKERTELVHRSAARLDPLTGLLNRRAFLAAGNACLARLTADRPTAALVFDLDGFKQINDRFGHPVGDDVLALFSETVRSQLRGSDLLGRLGGEEFAALLPDCDRKRALDVAERVRTAFSETAVTELAIAGLAPTVSVGVAVVASGQDLAGLLADADRAVYGAKASGRNRVCDFHTMRAAGPAESAVSVSASVATPRAA